MCCWYCRSVTPNDAPRLDPPNAARHCRYRASRQPPRAARAVRHLELFEFLLLQRADVGKGALLLLAGGCLTRERTMMSQFMSVSEFNHRC